MPLDPRRLAVVTGDNSKFFLHVLLLQESFARHRPGPVADAAGVMVCDYGLNDAEREFFRRRGCLLPAPTAIDPDRHAWYYKAAMCDYVPWPEDGALMWLDADALVTDDIAGRVLALAGDGPERCEAYACSEKSCSFSLIFDTLQRDGRQETLDAYRGRYGITVADPYVSSGVFVIFEREILSDWKNVVWSDLEPHVLFEQNAFNVALKGRRVGVLDPEVFNISQWDLLTCRMRDEDRAMVNGKGAPAAFIHMTANGKDVLVGETVAWRDGDKGLRMDDYILRRPNNPAIRLLQDAYISRIVRKFGAELIELGLAQSLG
jgi:hypothetical protein